MNRTHSLSLLILNKGSLFVLLQILLSFTFLANAGLIQTAVPTPPQSLTGGAMNTNSALWAADRGFSKASSAITALGSTSCVAALQFMSTSQTANNGVTSGDIVYDVLINTTGSTPVNQCYTVSFIITPNAGSPQTISLFVTTGSTNVAGESIDCKFDIGSSLPSSPFSFILKTSP